MKRKKEERRRIEMGRDEGWTRHVRFFTFYRFVAVFLPYFWLIVIPFPKLIVLQLSTATRATCRITDFLKKGMNNLSIIRTGVSWGKRYIFIFRGFEILISARWRGLSAICYYATIWHALNYFQEDATKESRVSLIFFVDCMVNYHITNTSLGCCSMTSTRVGLQFLMEIIFMCKQKEFMDYKAHIIRFLNKYMTNLRRINCYCDTIYPARQNAWIVEDTHRHFSRILFLDELSSCSTGCWSLVDHLTCVAVRLGGSHKVTPTLRQLFHPFKVYFCGFFWLWPHLSVFHRSV